MNNISQKIQVTPHHKSLASTISKFLAKQNKHIASNESTMEADEAVICDFGAQYKVLLTETSAGSAVELRVSIPSWNNLKEVSMKHLQGIFGESALIASKGAHQQHDFSIKVEQAMKAFDTSDECIQALSQVRILALGAPISLALQRIVDTSKRNDEKSSTTVQRLRMFPKCGQCYCLGSADKVMLVFAVEFQDETERALARLFMQQFAGCGKQVSQSPHCEFRRGNEAPKEILDVVRVENDDAVPLGYLSFTFFPSHIKSTERIERAVENMVNFLPYLDKHVKSTKSYMHSRMRSKKDDLLRELRTKNNTEQKQGKPSFGFHRGRSHLVTNKAQR